MLLKDKVALVTGGAAGIGREIALNFAREGADVAICDLQQEKSRNVCEEIEKIGRRAMAVSVDVSDTKEVAENVNKIIDSLERIDILVNNAGVTRDGLLMRMSEEDWDFVIKVNLKSVYNFTKAVIRPMMKQRHGNIVSISSVVGLNGNAGQVNYSASKAGIIGFTKSVAKEVANRGVRVNAIAPGFIKTKMTDELPDKVKTAMKNIIPMGEFGEPADVAGAAVFLASDRARYITGQVLVVDGGMVM
jgi:3-oxoacyl-[acyl-carrier protein] reductase